MSSTPSSNLKDRRSIRPHSSYNEAAFKDINPSGGVPIQCQHCIAQDFRRSRLHLDDLKHLFMMRYPVRCLRCSQRQLVSFTIAGLSIPSHIKQRRARRILNEHKHWSEPEKHSEDPASDPSPDDTTNRRTASDRTPIQ